jgi:hypothetical protein
MTFRGLLLCVIALAAPERAVASDLSGAIDAQIERAASEQQVPVAPLADDAEFFRRLTLDLKGRIPTAAEVREFLSDQSADKRTKAIHAALRHADHESHFATIWRRLLLPEAESQQQIQYFLPGFEAWLKQSRRDDVGFDRIVHDLVAAPIHGTPEQPQIVLTDLSAPNPIAYIATKEADPGKIAAGVSRLFLGIRIECAQCHDHPFDRWTRDQFWNQAAFFTGISRRGRGAFAPVVEDRSRRSIVVAETERTVTAMFLTGEQPEIADGASARKSYAAWMTSRENPFFAKAVVNRIWFQLMGTGLVDPVDDFQSQNPASHPELLDILARAFIDSGFQLDVLYVAICESKAYQRTSRQTDASQADPRIFARMAIKPMSAEQLDDSIRLLLESLAGPNEKGDAREDRRRSFLDLFATPDASGEPLTSMPQALYLMNGARITALVQRLGSSRAQAKEPPPIRDSLEELYLSTLGRLPTDAEWRLLEAEVVSVPASDQPTRLGDLCWALLNSAEFRWNH